MRYIYVSKTNLNFSRPACIIKLLVLVAILIVLPSACGGSMIDGEESGTQFDLDESCDMVQNGARLRLSYDADRQTFIGTVENTTGDILKQVRVEIHLSNGTELGPTTPKNIDPGESIDIRLAATNQDFDTWAAHPEVGEHGGEHGHGEGSSEHGQGGDGEHSKGGSSK